MKNKNIVLFCVMASILALCLGSCSGISHQKPAKLRDSVILGQIEVRDTTSYLLNGSDKCKIFAEASIEYPKLYLNPEQTGKLQRLFSEVVLDIPSDSVPLPLTNAFNRYVENQLSQYVNNNASIGEDTEVDYEPVYNYNTIIKITVPFNENGILNFCKTETTKKNGKVTTTRHYYYTIDLNNMTRVELNNLFTDEAISDISDMLKSKLMAQLNVKNADELNDMGYFNIDNLVANNNFYLTEDGLTWNYLPRELSVIDEVQISLSYDSLSAYIQDSSVLSPFIAKK